MPHELLAKPGTVTNNAIVEGAISIDAGASDILFVVKAAAVQISSEVEVVEVTGADDNERIFEQGRFASTQFQIQGYMVSDSAINIKNLVSSNNDGNTNSNCKLVFRPHSGRKLEGTVVFRGIDISWSRNSPFVGVTMTGMFTKVDFTASAEEA